MSWLKHERNWPRYRMLWHGCSTLKRSGVFPAWNASTLIAGGGVAAVAPFSSITHLWKIWRFSVLLRYAIHNFGNDISKRELKYPSGKLVQFVISFSDATFAWFSFRCERLHRLKCCLNPLQPVLRQSTENEACDVSAAEREVKNGKWALIAWKKIWSEWHVPLLPNAMSCLEENVAFSKRLASLTRWSVLIIETTH